MIEIELFSLMLTIIIFAFLLSVLIVAAWIGGSHNSSKQCRIVSDNYKIVMQENQQLRQNRDVKTSEFVQLQKTVFSLQNRILQYEQIISDLSSKVVWLREILEDKGYNIDFDKPRTSKDTVS